MDIPDDLESVKGTKNFNKNYELEKKLDEGTYASVYLARNKNTKEVVAVKVQRKAPGKKLDDEGLFEEVKLHKRLVHPHAVQIFDVFRSKSVFIIVLEYMRGGMLFDIVAEKGHFSEAQASIVMRQLLLGVEHLHNRGVVHRDIKPENILCVSKKWPLKVKLCDFGLATSEDDEGDLDSQTTAGSLNYCAPEVLRCEKYGKEVDMWSCGVILYILLTGVFPTGGHNEKDLMENLKKGRVVYAERYWGNISGMGVSLVRSLLQIDPRKRLTATAALRHEWLEKPEQLKQQPHGNNMRGIHSNKLRRALFTAIALNRMGAALNDKAQ